MAAPRRKKIFAPLKRARPTRQLAVVNLSIPYTPLTYDIPEDFLQVFTDKDDDTFGYSFYMDLARSWFSRIANQSSLGHAMLVSACLDLPYAFSVCVTLNGRLHYILRCTRKDLVFRTVLFNNTPD